MTIALRACSRPLVTSTIVTLSIVTVWARVCAAEASSPAVKAAHRMRIIGSWSQLWEGESCLGRQHFATATEAPGGLRGCPCAVNCPNAGVVGHGCAFDRLQDGRRA